MPRERWDGPINSYNGFEVGYGEERKVVIDADGNLNADVVGDFHGDTYGHHYGDVTGNVNGDVVGSLEGDVNGNVTGDVTGDLTGSVTGNVVGNLTGNVLQGSLLNGNVENGYVNGALYGDFFSAITSKTPAEIASEYAVSSGTWRMFVTDQGEIVILTPEGARVISSTLLT